MKSKEKEFTYDGFEIVYVSKSVFNAIEKSFKSVMRHTGNPSPFPTMALRDMPALIEFRRLEHKEAQLQEKK